MSAIPAKENKIFQFRIIEGGKKSDQKKVVDNFNSDSDNVHSLNKKKGVSQKYMHSVQMKKLKQC